MQFHLLFTVFVGAAYAATLTPADCDCVSRLNRSPIHCGMPVSKVLT